jgi:hypothetical protein
MLASTSNNKDFMEPLLWQVMMRGTSAARK